MTQVTQNMLKESVDVLNVRRHLAVFDRAESSRPSSAHLLLRKLLKMQTMILQALNRFAAYCLTIRLTHVFIEPPFPKGGEPSGQAMALHRSDDLAYLEVWAQSGNLLWP